MSSVDKATPTAAEMVNLARQVPVLCFAEQKDMKNSETVGKLFWGRSGNESEART
jgi:hypothetical protein